MSTSVWRRKQLRLIAEASSDEERNKLRAKPAWPIDALGSGSDYTAFLDFAGVASLNLAYGGADESNGVYHSAYDDFYWFTHFDDPTFGYEPRAGADRRHGGDATGRCRFAPV